MTLYRFPDNLYTDVRIEKVYSTKILLENFELKQNKTKTDTGAMIRIFDGRRWYYNATTEVDNIQAAIDNLATMAVPDPAISDHPVVRRIEVNRGEHLRYADNPVHTIANPEKIALLQTYVPLLQNESAVQKSRIYYLDNNTVKHIISSQGTDLYFDRQSCSISLRYTLQGKDAPFDSGEDIYETSFDKLADRQDKFETALARDLEFCRNAVPVKPGVYTCVLSPVVTGVFAHESFGHKSEADFMIGDETMKREWAIGKQVGAPILNIIDTGLVEGAGYVPFDDEGCQAKENYIIKDGILTGRLHSSYTAALLAEEPTGNARATTFEFEPIVRMTTTYIGSGHDTLDSLLAPIREGVYIDDLNHGSGMTTFTIAPKKAYMIRDGKIAEPVHISVITGNVMKTLNEIDGVSDEVKLFSFALGGCGKMEQFPLPVGFGGPYIRAGGIQVQ